MAAKKMRLKTNQYVKDGMKYQKADGIITGWPCLVVTAEVKKINKRLWVQLVETGELVYTPPDFIYKRMNSRADLQRLADRIGYYDEIIDEIIIWETEMSPCSGIL